MVQFVQSFADVVHAPQHVASLVSPAFHAAIRISDFAISALVIECVPLTLGTVIKKPSFTSEGYLKIETLR